MENVAEIVPSPSFSCKPEGSLILASLVKFQEFTPYIDSNLVALIENNVAGLGGDVGIIPGQGCTQRAYLFKTAIFFHGDGNRSLGKQLFELSGRTVVLKDSRKFIVSHCNFQNRFLLFLFFGNRFSDLRCL